MKLKSVLSAVSVPLVMIGSAPTAQAELVGSYSFEEVVSRLSRVLKNAPMPAAPNCRC